MLNYFFENIFSRLIFSNILGRIGPQPTILLIATSLVSFVTFFSPPPPSLSPSLPLFLSYPILFPVLFFRESGKNGKRFVSPGNTRVRTTAMQHGLSRAVKINHSGRFEKSYQLLNGFV